MNAPIGPVETAAFEAANSRAYLKAVFQAWAEGHCVMALAEGAGRKTVPGTSVLTRESFQPDPGWFEAELPARPAEDSALIAFSSGTTGRPKAILLSHGALQDVVGRINGAMGVTQEIREYLGVPVTYSFGFGRARAVAAAGGRAFLPEHGFNPSEIAAMLAADEINAVSAVPTLWRVLLANKGSISAEQARKLRWIEIGSQWMTAAEKLELRQLFPNAKIIQHYGLTEASRTTFLDISEAPEDRLDSVGQAVGSVEITVDADGHICTRGPHVATGLISGAGIKPVADEQGWLTTSDRGRIEDGWLYYEGRVDELINSGGLKIDPTAFEAAVNSALGAPGAVAAGRLADPLRGEKVLIALRQEAGLDRDAVAQAIGAEAERIGLTGSGSFELREVEAIPLTETGKVKRAELADLPDLAQSASKAADPVGDTATTGGKSTDLQALWGEILGLDTVPTDKSFYDLGGDSLSALTTIMKMESLGIDAEVARGIFEGKTIAEMAGGDPAPATEPASSGKAGELQTLWGEILGLETVPTDKSFYDLGGDSLSALTTIMKMESLGIDAEVARGIFEGKTIAEMAGGAPEAPAPVAAAPTTPAASAPVAAPVPSGKTAELKALWAEILGQETVPTDKSFYDLGGDSLSALTAIMKMESLGIDADVARGIFEGKTIAEMAGGDPAPEANAAPSGKAGELQALWGEILGLETVPTDKSFYDLGGDSLSALTTIMKMESLGIDADVARGIFEGKTIADLAGEDIPVAAPAPAAPPPTHTETPPVAAEAPKGPVLSLAETVNAVHAARGVLVLWVVLVHWLPSVLNRLGENTVWIYEALIPAWRFGTPGFAMVFGMGVGALGIHHYMTNKALFRKSSRFNTKLIVAGMFMMAAIKLLIVIAEGNFGERIPMSGLFYSAITYYALAMLTLPLMVWLLTRGPNRILNILAVGAGAWIIHSLLREYVSPLAPPAFFEFLKITFAAKYGFFRMTGFVMVGVAIGYLFRRHHAEPGLLRDLITAGLVLIAFGAVGVHQSDTPLADFDNVYLWHLAVYAGVALLVLSFFVVMNRAGGVKNRLLNRLNAFAIASGILALPIFVGHEMIGGIKHLLDVYGVPDLLSLVGLLTIFFGGLSVAYVRLMRFLR
ncbi:MAG: phosphopantetheine-binding protein [Pseudomonadota bacterium]